MPQHAKAIWTMLKAKRIRKSQRIEENYPVMERLVAGFDASVQDVMIVDVGAGHSHMLAGLRERMAHLPGRLLNQDLPHMVANIPSQEGVESQAHDFFSEQPIKS